MPDRVWPHPEEGKTWLGPWPSGLAPEVPYPGIENVRQFLKYQDTSPTPAPVGEALQTVCTWPGEGNGTLGSCVWALWSTGHVIKKACPAPLRQMANRIIFKLYLIFVKLVLGFFFIFKRNVYNWIPLQWKQLKMLQLMPAAIPLFQDSLPLLNWH